MKGVLDFWKPIGIIAECAGGVPEISCKVIGKIPLVYLDEDPDGEKGKALYVSSDNRQVDEVLQQTTVQGLSVSEDIAVVGVDDDPIICERTSPLLTSIGLDFEQGGFQCAQLLNERIRNPKLTSARQTFGVTSVTRRLSTRRFKQSDRRVAQAIAYIRRTACEGVTVPMVASVMGLRRRMAEIVFRRETGHSIHDEILGVRLERVESLIRSGRFNATSSNDKIYHRASIDRRKVLC